jgi:hypothetical protein
VGLAQLMQLPPESATGWGKGLKREEMWKGGGMEISAVCYAVAGYEGDDGERFHAREESMAGAGGGVSKMCRGLLL